MARGLVRGPLDAAVHDEQSRTDPEVAELAGGACRLPEREPLRTRDEHERAAALVLEHVHGASVVRAPVAQAGQLPQAGGAGRVLVEERGPCARQLEHPQRVAGRRRVEHDVVVGARDALVGEQARESVEGGYLHRAGARQLLLDVRDRVVRKDPPVGPHHALAVGRRLAHGVHLLEPEPGDVAGGDGVAPDLLPKDVPEVGRRVGRDEKDALPGVRERRRDGAGDARLADASLAREEEVLEGVEVAGVEWPAPRARRRRVVP